MVEEPAQPLDDRKPEAKPAAPIALGGKAIEFSKNTALLIVRNADTRVPYLDAQETRAVSTADDHAALSGVAYCVGHEIEQDALKQDEIAADPRAAGDDAQPQRLFARCRHERHLDALEQMINRKIRDAGSKHAGVELGDVQERVEQLVHCGHCSIHALDHASPLGLICLAAQLSDEQVQRVKRLSQVMARCGNEARLGEISELKLLRALIDLALKRRKGILELGGHAVEVVAERLQLVVRFDVDTMIERAGSDSLSAKLQDANRGHHLAGEHEACEHREDESAEHDQACCED